MLFDPSMVPWCRLALSVASRCSLVLLDPSYWSLVLLSVVTRIPVVDRHVVSGLMTPIFVCQVRLRAKWTQETDSARKNGENYFFSAFGRIREP